MRQLLGLPRFGLLTLYVALLSSSAVTTNYSLSVASYSLLTAVFLIEASKLFACVFYLAVHRLLRCGSRNLNGEGYTTPRLSWQQRLSYAVPAFFYAVDNYLFFVVLSIMQPAKSQLFGNISVVVTGLMFRFVLRRHLANIQWSSLLVLSCGLMTAEIKVDGVAFLEFGLGHALIFVQVVISAFANIWTERVLKQHADQKLAYQNIMMYGWGVAFNSMGLLVLMSLPQGVVGDVFNGPGSFFNGYSWLIVAVILLKAIDGLVISILLKYCDNMWKIMASSTSVFLTVLLSWAMLPHFDPPSLTFYLGCVVSFNAIYTYNVTRAQREKDVEPPVPRRASVGWLDAGLPGTRNVTDTEVPIPQARDRRVVSDSGPSLSATPLKKMAQCPALLSKIKAKSVQQDSQIPILPDDTSMEMEPLGAEHDNDADHEANVQGATLSVSNVWIDGAEDDLNDSSSTLSSFTDDELGSSIQGPADGGHDSLPNVASTGNEPGPHLSLVEDLIELGLAQPNQSVATRVGSSAVRQSPMGTVIDVALGTRDEPVVDLGLPGVDTTGGDHGELSII